MGVSSFHFTVTFAALSDELRFVVSKEESLSDRELAVRGYTMM